MHHTAVVGFGRTLLLLLGILFSIGSWPLARAQSPAADHGPLVTQAPGGVHIAWAAQNGGVGEPDLSGWPHGRLDGLDVPVVLVPLHVSGDQPITPQLQLLESMPSQHALPVALAIMPQTADGALRSDLAEPPPVRFPTTVVRVLRDTRMGPARIVVVAITPFFQDSRGARVATRLAIQIPAVSLATGSAGQPELGRSRLTAFPAGPAPSALMTRVVARIGVTSGGIQRISGAALSAAGIQLSASQLANLRLYMRGQEVALHEVGTADGSLDAGDELRFFAPETGDRWNAGDTYWLVRGDTPATRMTTRAVMPGSAPSAMALERVRWRAFRVYDTTSPGPAGDYWYAADMKTGPGLPAAMLTVPFTATVPLAAGSASMRVTGTAYTAGQHRLRATMAGTSHEQVWNGAGMWSFVFSFSNQAPSADLALVPGSVPDGVEIQSVELLRPVSLDVDGREARFEGQAGTWKYALSDAAAGRTLYDVTMPRAPVVLQVPAGPSFTFEDGSARRYVISGPGQLHEPLVMPGAPADLSAPLDSQVVYIVPAGLRDALAPLVALRQAQGYSVAVVDVQAIYDNWSGGQVDPNAIRSFLRYARGSWTIPPLAVTLVGDGTADPLDHLRHGARNVNLIPPYLAHVDPWLGETACETCYAQLDGDSPLDDILPDVMLGRLPAKNGQELTTIVAKIVAHDSAPASVGWQSRTVILADNYRQANNAIDGAGDFAAMGDAIAAMTAPGVDVRRLYYDPSPSRPAGQPWREPDESAARAKALALLDEGAAVVTYIGHSHQFQWAVTNSASPAASTLVKMYDADLLANEGRLPVLRTLTCLSAAFQTPAYDGTTIDERMVVVAGRGAVAAWGPTGLGVAHGHDALARGFDRALWAAEEGLAPVGMLVNAGYLELVASSPCCLDSVRTYVLLGDPLTRLRVQPAQRIYLPLVQN